METTMTDTTPETNTTTIQKRKHKKRKTKQKPIALLTTETKNNSTQEEINYPIRNVNNLYTTKQTYDCATLSKCVPCAYKIGCFDVKRPPPQQPGDDDDDDDDKEDTNNEKENNTIVIKIKDEDFVSKCPNSRPENCPRFFVSSSSNNKSTTTDMNNVNQSKQKETETHHDSVSGGYYQSGMNILTIGDGDLSFSRALYQKYFKQGEGRLICTSYESKSTLHKVYPSDSISPTIQELEREEEEEETGKKKNVSVCYNVDATNLKGTLPSTLVHEFFPSSSSSVENNKDDSKVIQPLSLDRIIWNFPCIAISNGYDGQRTELDDNIQMVRKFIKNAIPFLKPPLTTSSANGKNNNDAGGGEIHICHKTKPPFDLWNMEAILKHNDNDDDDDDTSIPKNFVYKGRIVFDRCLYPPYVPRKALDYKSFPCHDACVYVFGFNTTATADEDENMCRIDNEKDTANSNNNKKEEKCDQHHYFPPTLVTNDDDSLQHENDNDYGIIPLTNEMIQNIRNLHLMLSSMPYDGKSNGSKKKQQQQKKRKGDFPSSRLEHKSTHALRKKNKKRRNK
mmetsp:Transcript_36099/g.52876  ORF Transcript_36099/g.52876 Transcript_36099/m.52876 type:complete len:565 (+) Transcript_36099:18-1712(+)